jgi:hypothetical protein
VNLSRPLIATALATLLTMLAVACGDDDDAASETTEQRAGSTPSDCPAEPTEQAAADLVGLSEADATSAAEACGWILRVVRRDGEDLAATRDFRPNRVNVEVTDGEVTAIVNTG